VPARDPLLEERLESWRHLARSLGAGVTVLATANVTDMEQLVQREQSAIEALQRIEAGWQERASSGTAAPSLSFQQAQFDAVRQEVSHLLLVHSALLRRIRRNILFLQNVRRSFAETYTPVAGSERG
jgi:hypothetical protein